MTAPAASAAAASNGASSSAATNLVTITSPEHFTDTMSQDLQRVSLLNFWTPWAEPCKQMNEVVSELAQKYPQILCLNIEAETLPDVSESFDIDSVPSFVLLKGHTLLSRISGANAAALHAAVSSHAAKPASGPSPYSQTSAAPRAAPDTYTAVSGTGGGSIGAGDAGAATEESGPHESEAELEERCKALMEKERVMLFMKGNPETPRCGFSQKTVALLRQEKVEFGHFDILQDEGVRQGLKKLNDWPTFPQIIVNGELIGGLDILKEQIETGEFRELLGAA